MNRERLTILRDHLASLPDERFDMKTLYNGEQGFLASWSNDGPAAVLNECGTVACVAAWALYLFEPHSQGTQAATARQALGLSERQGGGLFVPAGYWDGDLTRTDAIAAIQSMLDSPDDDALPVWPSPSNPEQLK